jgi:hypothetical protein
LLIVYHFIAFLWNNFAVPILAYFIIQFALNATYEFSAAYAAAAGASGFSFGLLLLIAPFVLKGLLWTAIALFLALKFKQIVSYKFGRMKLPMITYPECQTCECVSETTKPNPDTENGSPPSAGLISQVSDGNQYNETLTQNNLSINRSWPGIPATDDNFELYFQLESIGEGVALAGQAGKNENPLKFKTLTSNLYTFPNEAQSLYQGITLPPGERVNVYNTRKKFFDNVNKIKVTFEEKNLENSLKLPNEKIIGIKNDIKENESCLGNSNSNMLQLSRVIVTNSTELFFYDKPTNKISITILGMALVAV